MSFIYTAFGEKINIENFTETNINESNQSNDNQSNDNQSNNNQSNEKEVVDVTVYSHIRLYNKDKTCYITLYPKYIGDEGQFAISLSPIYVNDNLISNEVGAKLNVDPLLKYKVDDVVNDKFGLFSLINNKIIMKKGEINNHLFYDHGKKILQISTEEKDVNVIVPFKFTKSEETRLNVYDNIIEDKRVAPIFYKVNKTRDTFYLSRDADCKKLIQIGRNDVHNLKKFDFEKRQLLKEIMAENMDSPTLFSFKPIMNQNEKNKFPDFDMSSKLQEELKKMFSDEIDYKVLKKVNTAMIEKKEDNLSTDEKDIRDWMVNFKLDKEREEIWNEFIVLLATTIVAENAPKYYLVKVQQEGEENHLEAKCKTSIKLTLKKNVNKYDLTEGTSDDKYIKVWLQ